jgi:hypothetical protein
VLNAPLQGAVVDVPAIPREKVLQAVRRRKAKMGGIIGGNRRDDVLAQQMFGQPFSRWQRVENCYPAKHFQAGSGKPRVSATGFGNYQLRNEQIKIVAALLPPLFRILLIREQSHVLARSRHQIAGNRGFEIKARFHVRFNLPLNQGGSREETDFQPRNTQSTQKVGRGCRRTNYLQPQMPPGNS